MYDFQPIFQRQKDHSKWAKTYLPKQLAVNPTIMNSTTTFNFNSGSARKTSLCIGMVTRDRGHFYPTRAVASLLRGLTYARSRAHRLMDPELPGQADVTVLICNVGKSVADHTELAPYENSLTFIQLNSSTKLSNDRVQRLHSAECMSECSRRTHADYVLMLEDDAVAARTFLPRALSQLQSLERRDPNWGLLKLFWSDIYDGWSLEDIPKIVSLMIIGIALPPLAVWNRSGHLKRILPVLLYSAHICTAILVSALLIGKQNIFPAISSDDGVYSGIFRGDVYAVATLYPHAVTEEIISRLRDPRSLEVDFETWRSVRSVGRVPYIMQPSLFQHVGVHTSLEGHRTGVFKRHGFSYSFRED
eukprot:212848_1